MFIAQLMVDNFSLSFMSDELFVSTVAELVSLKGARWFISIDCV